MSDLDFQNFSTVQSNKQLGSQTIPAAATVAPVSLITHITGTTQLTTITPPVTGDHVLILIFPDAMGAFATSGNIAVAADPGVNIPVFMVYSTKYGKYYPGAIS
jgi:hypothetical protein